jgi:uncharacterized protein
VTAQARYEAEVLRVWGDAQDGAHDLWHLRRVWTLCQRIAGDQRGANRDVLLAAAIFHDVINLPKDHPNRGQAARLSADHAVQFLTQDFDETALDAIHHAILAHSFSAMVPATTLEAQILQDADRLEALGAIGIARCFNVSGQIGRDLFDGADPLARDRPLDDTAFALDHFEVKLFKVAAQLHTKTARAIAADRIEFMKKFQRRLATEMSPA